MISLEAPNRKVSFAMWQWVILCCKWCHWKSPIERCPLQCSSGWYCVANAAIGSPQPKGVLAKTTKQRQRAGQLLCRVTADTAENFSQKLQNTNENKKLQLYQRKRKTKRGNCTLCRVRGKLLVGGVCGRNCLIILSLLHQMPPYYCPAAITLLPFQLKSNCPPFNWNRYGTNGYKSSGFRSHETTDVPG